MAYFGTILAHIGQNRLIQAEIGPDRLKSAYMGRNRSLVVQFRLIWTDVGLYEPILAYTGRFRTGRFLECTLMKWIISYFMIR